MAATKRRLLNREKLSDIQSVDNLEKLLEQEIESIPQVSTALIDKDFQEKIRNIFSLSRKDLNFVTLALRVTSKCQQKQSEFKRRT